MDGSHTPTQPEPHPQLGESERAADQRKQEIIARVQNLTAEETIEYLYNLCDRWKIGPVIDPQSPHGPYIDITKTAFENFKVFGELDVSALGHFGLKDIDLEITTHEMEAMAIYHHLRSHNLVGTTAATTATTQAMSQMSQEEPDTGLPDNREVLNKMMKVMEMIYYAKRVVLSAFQAKLALHQVHCSDMILDDDFADRLGQWSLRFGWIEGKVSEMQELLMFLLDCAYERRLKKDGDLVYEPIVIGQYNTHAYKEYKDIKEWVYFCTCKETQWRQWCNLTSSTGIINSVCAYLTTCNDFQFPKLVKQRDVFSFRNGIYLARENRFHDFQTATEPLADTVVACNFFDMTFDPYTETHDWKNIPTPHFQGILDYQELPEDVWQWLYIFIGRMLYDIGTYDGWQIIPFLKGHAGTGKSTICLVVKKFYDALDVGIMSNNIERQFGLSAFYDKFMFIAPECRNDLAIEQAEFQSIVSGEDIQISMKHKTAKSVKWKVPGLLAGNEVPSWADTAGSIQRRLPVIDFIKPVVSGDMMLHEKLSLEIPELLLKCNRAYRCAAELHGSSNIWGLLGPYFQKTSNELAQTINALEAFMACDEVRYDPESSIPLDEFKNGLLAFSTMNGFPRPKFTTDYFRGPFSRHGVERRHCERMWRGRLITRDFLIGLDLAANVENEMNLL